MSKCTCPLAGFCKRHLVQKTELLHKLCSTDSRFFDAWELGKGPGQKNLPIYKTGTELKKLISWFPIPGKAGCKSCLELESKMNAWGPDKCEEKLEYIVNKLRLSAEERKLPFSKTLVEILVRKAINNSRK